MMSPALRQPASSTRCPRPLIVGLATCLCVLCIGCLTPSAAATTTLVVWGLPSGQWTHGRDAAIAEFTRRHPDIEVVSLSMGAGGMNPQKLMTSIKG